jgi:hypothetical protein
VIISTSPLVVPKDTLGVSETHSVDWQSFANWLAAQATLTSPRKEAIGLFTLTDAKTLVSDDVASVWGIGLDYDGTTQIEMQTALAAARGLGAGCAYTSYRHAVYVDPKRPDSLHRFRILLPFDRPLLAADYQTGEAYRAAWATVWRVVAEGVGRFHPTKAPGTSEANIGRRWFLPARNPTGPECWFDAWQGDPLPLDVLLAEGAATPTVGASSLDGVEVNDELDQSEPCGKTEIHTLGVRLSRSKTEETASVGRAICRAMTGHSFADEGGRNAMAFKMAGEIARAYPAGNAAQIAEIFAYAFEISGAIGAEGRSSVEAFKGQLQRQQRTKQAELRTRRQVAGMFAGMPGIGAEPPATKPEDAEQTGGPETRSTTPIAGALILQRNNEFWLRSPFSVEFHKECSKADVEKCVHDELKAHIPLFDEQGKRIPLQRILDTYSHHVEAKSASYLAQYNHYDPATSSVVLAPAPRRVWPGVRHAEVEEWIALLAGEQKGKVEEWFRGLFHLDIPSPALYVYGVTGVGKTLLIAATSQLWKHGHAKLEEVVDGFNEQCVATPLLAADEQLPSSFDLGKARRMLTQAERSINMKGIRPFMLRGYLRMMMCANNPDLLTLHRNQHLTNDDTEAVAMRFLVVHALEKASGFLKSLPDARAMVNMIPEHITWLHEQAPAKPKGRFAVHVESTKLADEIAGERYSAFVSWVLDYLSRPRAIESMHCQAGNPNGWFVRTKWNQLWIAFDARHYALGSIDERRVLDDWRRAMRYFSTHERSIRVPGLGSRKYREIDVEKLITAAQDAADIDAIARTLAVSTETRVGVTEDA